MFIYIALSHNWFHSTGYKGGKIIYNKYVFKCFFKVSSVGAVRIICEMEKYKIIFGESNGIIEPELL